MDNVNIIQADFDRIAAVDQSAWSHNEAYHAYLLKQLPSHLESALEIGCGTGVFAHLLAWRSDRVLGIDLSPEMVRLARELSEGFSNVEFSVEDALVADFPDGSFDCIASIATLHHLPLEIMLQKMKSALRENGVLLILDLYKQQTWGEYASSLVAFPANPILRWVKTGSLRAPIEVRQAWETHGQHDVYLTFRQIQQACEKILLSARVRRHLFWRYSVVWKKT